MASENIILESPIIIRNKTAMFPLRDALEHIDADLEYLRKDHAFRLHLKKQETDWLFAINSPEVWVNHIQHFLPQPSIFFEGRFYVALNAFFTYNGYKVTKSKEGFNVSKGISPPISKSTFLTNPKEKLLYSSKYKLINQPDRYSLPTFEKDRKLFLSFGQNFHDIQRQFFYKKGILFVALGKILRKEGFSVTAIEDDVVIKKNGRSYKFSLKNRNAVVTIKGNSYTQHLLSPLIRRGDTYFYPLVSVFSALDLHVRWNGAKREITALSQIHRFEIVKQKNQEKLLIHMSHSPQNAAIKPFPQNNGFILDLPFSASVVKKSVFFFKNGPIIQMSVSDSSDLSTQIQFFTKNKLLFPSLKETPFGLELSFYPIIRGIKESATSKSRIIEITGSRPFEANVWTSKKPPRLIIDIPQTISHLPQILRSNNNEYKRIRTSQLSKAPPKTRIVIDTQKTPTGFTKNQAGKTLTISIPREARKVTIEKPRKTGRLANKVVILDAGHGGRDPGGIGVFNDYEKTFTLDVTKRVKRKLQNDGAFVIMAREGNYNPSLRRRVRIANRNKGDIFISIHFNSFIKPYAHGTETYYYKYKDKQLARSIQRELVKQIKLKNNGVKRARLYVLRHSKMPAALVEPLFISNRKEMKKLESAAFREKIATGIFLGARNYLTKN